MAEITRFVQEFLSLSGPHQAEPVPKILVQDNPSPPEWEKARDLADRWRACHAYPINTFQATLSGLSKKSLSFGISLASSLRKEGLWQGNASRSH